MKLLYLTDRKFPSDHSFLETVYSKILPERNIDITWVMKTTQGNNFYKLRKWNNTDVLTFNTFGNKNIINTWLQNLRILFFLIRFSKNNKVELIQVRNWVWGGIVSIFLSKLTNAKFIFQHSFPRDLLLKKRIRSYKNLNKIRAYFELYWLKFILSKADYIFAISPAMKNSLIKKGIEEKRIFPVGLAFDEKINTNIDNSYIIKKYNLYNKKVAIYFGVMDQHRNLEFLIDIWSDVCKKIHNSVLLMVGGEDIDIERLMKYTLKLDIKDKIIFTGKVKRAEIPAYIKSSQLSISPIPPIPMYLVSSPTKIYESLGCGCPVVGNDLPEQGEVIRQSEGGFCIEYDHKQFVKAIVYLLENKKIAEKMGNVGREYILKHKTYQILANKIQKIYAKIC